MTANDPAAIVLPAGPTKQVALAPALCPKPLKSTSRTAKPLSVHNPTTNFSQRKIRLLQNKKSQ